MALVAANLESSILDILNGTTASPSAAAAGVNWGDAYISYASTAVPVPTILPAGETTLKSALGAAFSTLPGVPGTVASSIASAFDAFWLSGVTFVGAVPPGGVSGGGAALTTALSGIFVVVGGTHASKASQLATAIDTYTKLVAVTIPPAAAVTLT
jgi:hypothetical protein